MKITLNYNGVDWANLVIYDESSPSCLRWKVMRLGKGSATTKYPGDAAGTLIHKNRTSDYRSYKVAFNKNHYIASRIIYILFNGKISEDKVIDHIDRDSLNNKISNLRLVDEKINCRNLSRKSNNRSGVTGVSYSESSGYGYWNAECSFSEGGKHYRHRKQFSVLKLGYNNAFDLACKWRESVIAKLICDGVGFTEQHGT